MLAVESRLRRRTWAGLAGIGALAAATFTRYTDIVILGCAAVAVLVVWWRRAARLPFSAVGWWVASVAVFGAIAPNLRSTPAHLLQAMPVLVRGLASPGWIIVRWIRLRGASGETGFAVRRDLWTGLAIAASWFAVWGLYAAYYGTASAFGSTLQFARFYVPALGAIALLGAWLVTRVPGRAWLAGLASATVIAAMFGLGTWSFHAMAATRIGGTVKGCCAVGGRIAPGSARVGP